MSHATRIRSSAGWTPGFRTRADCSTSSPGPGQLGSSLRFSWSRWGISTAFRCPADRLPRSTADRSPGAPSPQRRRQDRSSETPPRNIQCAGTPASADRHPPRSPSRNRFCPHRNSRRPSSRSRTRGAALRSPVRRPGPIWPIFFWAFRIRARLRSGIRTRISAPSPRMATFQTTGVSDRR